MPLFYCSSYHKFTRGKDLRNYSDKDLACILGVKKPNDIQDYSNVKARENDVDILIGKVDNLYGVTTVNGGNMNDYFIKKKYKNVDEAVEENQAEFQCEKEVVEIELGENVHEAKIETKKKRSRKNTASSDMQGKDVDGQEIKESKLVLNSDSTNDSKCKKKKRKLEQEAKEGEQLLKDDERNTERYSEKDAFNFEEKDIIIKQEHKRKRKKKQKENPDMDGQEVEQKTDGNEVNDNSANYLNYKTKKRKLEHEAKEHLLKEEEIMKQDGRSVEESYIEKDMYGCEVEDNQIKRKKKQKEKYTEIPDACGREVETHRNETTLLHDDSVNGLNCKKKKRKLKQEVKERIENEIIEQDKTGKDGFDSSAPTIFYRSKKKREKNLLRENNEFVHYQDSIPAGDTTTQKKDSFKQLKNGKKSIYRDTEKVDHCEIKDNEIVEEEDRKHKIKKKKKGKYDKDGSTHGIQEHSLVQYNLEETHAENCEELSQNVEGSKEARNNPKCKQDVCNSDVENSAGANIRIANFEKTDVNRRNMRPSVFAQLVDPSLIRFRGSNLCRIPGYGCY
jgi:Pin2-interacting protein X1